jgi:hypothetical protein
MADTRNSFLLHRSTSHAHLSTNYRKLYELVKELDLIALSGDVAGQDGIPPLTDFNEIGLGPDEPTYWPTDMRGGNAGVIEICNERFGMLMRLSVQTDGYYGVSRLGCGNHDMSITEVKGNINMVIEQLRREDPAIAVRAGVVVPDRLRRLLPPRYQSQAEVIVPLVQQAHREDRPRARERAFELLKQHGVIAESTIFIDVSLYDKLLAQLDRDQD